MSDLVSRDQRSPDLRLDGWRDRRHVGELHRQARLAELDEKYEAQRMATRIDCGSRLARLAAGELVLTSDEFSALAGSSASLALDLADLHKVLALGCKRIVHDYLGRR